MTEWVIEVIPDWGTKTDGDVPELKKKLEEHYLLQMPNYGEDGFYRQTRSFNAFFHTWNKRIEKAFKKYGAAGSQKFHPNHRDGYFYYAKFRDEWEAEQKRFIEFGAKRYKRPEFTKTFTSIWEFYEYIGFNHKTRKYECQPTSTKASNASKR